MIGNRPSLRRRPDENAYRHSFAAEMIFGDENEGQVLDPRSRRLLTMATHHLTALVLVLYGLYVLCRIAFGWDPTKRDPPPPTYTIHVKGITDDTATGSMWTVTWNLRGDKGE
jgi:hypothetical protein